jgi:hypothetical protein
MSDYDFAERPGSQFWDSRPPQRPSDTHPVRWRVRPDYDDDRLMAYVTEAVCDGCGWAEYWYGVNGPDTADYVVIDIEEHTPRQPVTITEDS